MNKVLVIGSGGREHALALKLAESKQVSQVFVAPGNAGMELAINPSAHKIQCIDISAVDKEALVEFARKEDIQLTVVGPETSLAIGLVDAFRQHDLAIVGPNQSAARLESSKTFAKDILTKAKVPTAEYRAFKANEFDQAIAFVRQQNSGLVVKEDGLAAGKGVYIHHHLDDIENNLSYIMKDLNHDLVIEELLEGEELSYFSLLNGDHIIPLALAQDYKRAFDDDKGPNTGGMGSISPVPGYDEEALMEECNQIIVRPLIQALKAEGISYTGILYTGLMMTKDGPKVIEFNARFGDPETQVVLERIVDDFYHLLQVHLNQEIYQVTLKPEYCLGVVVAALGYPGTYPKGMPIQIPENLLAQVRFAGVKSSPDYPLISQGGRILMLIQSGDQLDNLSQEIYQKLNQIQINQTYYRKDIAQKHIKKGD